MSHLHFVIAGVAPGCSGGGRITKHRSAAATATDYWYRYGSVHFFGIVVFSTCRLSCRIYIANMTSTHSSAITTSTTLMFLVVLLINACSMSCVGAFQPPVRQLSSHTSTISALSPLTTTSLDMFTGIIEEMGSVVSLEQRDDMTLWDGTKGSGTELVVKGDVVMDGAYLG